MNWNDTHKQLYSAACGFLARREHGRSELMKKLIKKFENATSTEIDEVMEFLVRKNFQSDERYAYLLVKSKFSKFYGPAYIKQFAYTKGLDIKYVEQALQEFDFDEKCCEFARKHENLDRLKLRRKILQKGFNFSQAVRSIKNLD